MFKGLLLNNGGNYDLTSGYFNAPYNGLYAFNFTTYATMEKRLRLMKNHFEVRMLSKDGKSNSKKSTNKDILLNLEEGDRVWVRVAHAKRNRVQNGTNSTMTTFSGRLVTTEVHIDIREPSVTHNRHKRSLGQRSSLQRTIRESNFPPVSLIPKELSNAVNHEINHDVTGGESNQKIAFSVTCTKSMIGGHMADTTVSLDGAMSPEAAPNGRIAFDKTFVNIGNGFDIENAEFTAPTNGVYYFSYNVGKFPRKKLSVMLMKNFNEVQSIIYNDNKNRAREIQGQSLMLELKENDRIWLRSYNDKDYAVYSNFGNYITFSGYLVYAL